MILGRLSERMDEFIEQRVGQTLGGRWVLQSVLGVGGMAAVYAAVDATGQQAAVKVLHPEIGMRAELRDRFMREGTVANRIDHPGAVRVLEHGVIDDRSAFLVMERLQGESLGERVARDGMLPLPELLDVLDQVLDVLAVAHDAGIVHRDLKPDNLFMTDDGAVKVLDFGVARVLDGAPDDVRTRTGMAMGTLSYMAPEQALGKRSEIDGRVDIFALGATAFRILAKRRVHEANSDAGMLLAMASKAAPPLGSVVPNVPENIAAIVDLALAFHRDARYPDARTMQADVRAAMRGEKPPFASARLQARDDATRPGIHVPVLPLTAPAAATSLRSPTAVAAPRSAGAALPPNVPSPRTPTVVAPQQGSTAAPAVTPPPARPSTVAEPTPATGASAPALTPAVQARSDQRSVPRRLVALGALGCVLLGAVLWLMWPSSEQASPQGEPIDAPESDVGRAMAAERASEPREQRTGASEAARERSQEEQERARELLEETLERQRGKGKKKGRGRKKD